MRLLFTISVASLCASLLAAQGPERATLATRDRLTADLARLEAQNNSGARVQAALIRDRLANGDFQVGDRILIRVDGEPQLSDTFTVQAGPRAAAARHRVAPRRPARGVGESSADGTGAVPAQPRRPRGAARPVARG